MDTKLDLLTEKIELLITKMETLKTENEQLKSSNNQLQDELNEFKRNYESLKLSTSDKNEVAKTKLTTILNRLDQLEELAS